MNHVWFWHETDMAKYLDNVRYWVNSGKHVLALSFSGFDPQPTWVAPERLIAILVLWLRFKPHCYVARGRF